MYYIVLVFIDFKLKSLPEEVVLLIKEFLPKFCSEESMERHRKVDFRRQFKYGIVTGDHAQNVI